MRSMLLGLCLLSACDGGEGGEERLIPTTDGQFSELERPELVGECTTTPACNSSCLHSCIPVSEQPMTCPADPPAVPERLVGASCVCDEQVCQWR